MIDVLIPRTQASVTDETETQAPTLPQPTLENKKEKETHTHTHTHTQKKKNTSMVVATLQRLADDPMYTGGQQKERNIIYWEKE